jgi:hypothetical protein
MQVRLVAGWARVRAPQSLAVPLLVQLLVP